ncbi:MAG TPA: M55 family metallopeptidase [Gemmatimonadales bacterium]|nr:M55 family metallopeptidase [Gemmatimonadales bacterium]
MKPTFLLALLPAVLAAQAPRATYPQPKLPPAEGYRVYIIPDMEGMGSVVNIHEVIAGIEGKNYTTLTGPDYWNHSRSLMTQEVNAVIRGARLSGARSFVVNEGHGGNLFANIIPEDLDTAALLIRGFPKPLIMITGIDSSVGTVIFTGAHAGPGHPGVLAHNYSFDHFSVDGHELNEVGINALIAGEYGVGVSMISGDDGEIAQCREILGDKFVGVITKWALSPGAAITYSPVKERRMLADSAAKAVRLARAHAFTPYTLPRPYQVEFTLRASYPDSIVTAVDSLHWPGLEKTSGRTYRLTTGSAVQMGYLLDAIESVVLK